MKTYVGRIHAGPWQVLLARQSDTIAGRAERPAHVAVVARLGEERRQYHDRMAEVKTFIALRGDLRAPRSECGRRMPTLPQQPSGLRCPFAPHDARAKLTRAPQLRSALSRRAVRRRLPHPRDPRRHLRLWAMTVRSKLISSTYSWPVAAIATESTRRCRQRPGDEKSDAIHSDEHLVVDPRSANG